MYSCLRHWTRCLVLTVVCSGLSRKTVAIRRSQSNDLSDGCSIFAYIYTYWLGTKQLIAANYGTLRRVAITRLITFYVCIHEHVSAATSRRNIAASKSSPSLMLYINLSSEQHGNRTAHCRSSVHSAFDVHKPCANIGSFFALTKLY